MTEKQTVLVIGGAGLIGGEISRALIKEGHTVVIADIKELAIEGAESKKLNIFEPGIFRALIEEVQPALIINTVNVATLFSKNPHQGYDHLVKFYIELYRNLRALHGHIHYVQVGTTGSGGLGFNIPFTHGDRIEELPIINKAAFAGITTSMLILLSRSFSDGKVKISEMKPGLAIFGDGIYVRELHGVNLVTLDGGESGHYTYNETMLLTQFMGFTCVSRIAEKLMAVIDGVEEKRIVTRYDLTANSNHSIITQDEDDEVLKKDYVERMKKMQGESYIIATGNLGPPSVTRDLILAHLIASADECGDMQAFTACLESDACAQATLHYVEQENSDLYHYLRAECTFHNYQLLRHYWREGAEPWQIAGASLSKVPLVF